MSINNFRSCRCSNERCAHLYLYNINKKHMPLCPKCNSRAQFPAPFAHKGTAKNIDATLKDLSEAYGLSDMGQRGGTREGEIAKKMNLNSGSATYSPRPGFEIPFDTNPSCAWSKNPPNSKIGVDLSNGAKFAKKAAVPTKIVGSHKG